MKLKLRDYLLKRNNLVPRYPWLGWMGGQWAFADEVATICAHNQCRNFLHLYSGPGELSFYLRRLNVIGNALCVDISKEAEKLYCLLKGEGSLDEAFQSLCSVFLSNSKYLDQNIIDVQLASPVISSVHYLKGFDCNVDFRRKEVLEYLKSFRSESTIFNSVFDICYVGSPTFIPEIGGCFYYNYDSEAKFNTEKFWLTHEAEISYLKEVFYLLKGVVKKGVLFGVGSGRTSLNSYIELFNQTGFYPEVISHKVFYGDNFEFEDDLIFAMKMKL